MIQGIDCLESGTRRTDPLRRILVLVARPTDLNPTDRFQLSLSTIHKPAETSWKMQCSLQRGRGEIMKYTSWTLLALASFSLVPATSAGAVADLNADWSNTNNANSTSFGTWSYRQGSSLLPETANWNGTGSVGFTATQPAWAPSNIGGDFLPAEFKATSVPAAVPGINFDWQVGDVVVHTTDSSNGASNGPANFLWTSPNTGTVTISGSLWEAATLAGRDNSWSLLENGVVVSSGASIDGHDRANPFLLGDGTGGNAALTLNVSAGSTIDLQITKTTAFGYFVGANFTITEASVPEPSSLFLGGFAVTALAMTALSRRTRKT
jgi:hypothetical protein